VADRFDGIRTFLHGCQRALGMRHKGVPGIRKRDAAASPFEEAVADFTL
jgi:hypothetical protein